MPFSKSSAYGDANDRKTSGPFLLAKADRSRAWNVSAGCCTRSMVMLGCSSVKAASTFAMASGGGTDQSQTVRVTFSPDEAGVVSDFFSEPSPPHPAATAETSRQNRPVSHFIIDPLLALTKPC